MSSTNASSTPSEQVSTTIDPNFRIEELSSAHESTSDDESSSSSDDGVNVHGWLPSKLASVPSLYTSPPLIKDTHHTASSAAQEKVMRECLELLTGEGQTIFNVNSHGLPHLQQRKHKAFLEGVLGRYPPPYQVMDASRPWLLYWALNGLRTLGYDVKQYKDRVIQTFTPLQNPEGGFGGGHGHLSHAAASYAATLSLALVGGLDMIDRKTMWQWLGSTKQQNGGFTMAINGEQDVRGAYCNLTIHVLLNLPSTLPPSSPARSSGFETFTDGLGEWFSRCQTFEGGMGANIDNEAHGAYAFCSLACLSLLDAPHISIPKYLDLPRLVAWVSSRQSAPEGGYNGRTNKLVDACYSHWVGACWSHIEAALRVPESQSLWDREGLVRYTLCISQAKKGGLRDKPNTRPDGYHSNYSLAGLSGAQYKYTYDGGEGEGENELKAAFNWSWRAPDEEQMKTWGFDEVDLVKPVHPVFVLPFDVVEDAKAQFGGKIGFWKGDT